MSKNRTVEFTSVPTQWIGPALVNGLLPNAEMSEEVFLPLATYETPMWPSVRRGSLVFNACGGLNVQVVSECMTRSIVFSADSMAQIQTAWGRIVESKAVLVGELEKVSRFTILEGITPEFVGNLLYLRLAFKTGDASGHNMATLGAQVIQSWILNNVADLRYGSLSANYCVDKKVSAVNGILGRGKHVIADCLISDKVLRRFLHSSAERLHNLHIQKNLMGSVLAGSVRSANAHFANMLLAFYLATGQDGANVVEGSQGITHLERRGENGEDLYFSVSIPNIIVGSVGNGKHLPEAQKALERLGCLQQQEVGDNSKRLSCLAAVAVACGELSLLAALTNEGELVDAHIRFER
jgi:hydroxymethylglutaryl-CoA reductase (NADPH)